MSHPRPSTVLAHPALLTLRTRLVHVLERHVRTKKTPIQPIPLFEELLELLMQPANRHIRFNVSRIGLEQGRVWTGLTVCPLIATRST